MGKGWQKMRRKYVTMTQTKFWFCIQGGGTSEGPVSSSFHQTQSWISTKNQSSSKTGFQLKISLLSWFGSRCNPQQWCVVYILLKIQTIFLEFSQGLGQLIPEIITQITKLPEAQYEHWCKTTKAGRCSSVTHCYKCFWGLSVPFLKSLFAVALWSGFCHQCSLLPLR